MHDNRFCAAFGGGYESRPGGTSDLATVPPLRASSARLQRRPPPNTRCGEHTSAANTCPLAVRHNALRITPIACSLRPLPAATLVAQTVTFYPLTAYTPWDMLPVDDVHRGDTA